MWPDTQPNATSMNLYSHKSSHITKENKPTVVSIHNAMVSTRRFFENSPNDHETWSIWWHIGIHVDFTTVLQSHTRLVPQLKCKANLGRLCLFHQWECLKCNGHGLSAFCVEWPWNMIHLMTCGNPCRLYNHLAITYSFGPSSIVWSELGPAPPFPPMRVLEMQRSRALTLVCEVALKHRWTIAVP